MYRDTDLFQNLNYEDVLESERDDDVESDEEIIRCGTIACYNDLKDFRKQL